MERDTINAEALIRLADKLEGKGPYTTPVPEDAFDIRLWHTENSRRSCGYVACACGWAATDAWFISRGFVLGGRYKTHPCYGEHYGSEAIEAFFHITAEEALHLFYPAGYDFRKPTQFEVAARIREFVARKADVADLWACTPAECF